MADIDLKVNLQADVKQAKGLVESLDNKGAFKSNPKKRQEIDAMIKSLENFLEILNPKNSQQISSARAQFNDLTKAIIKFGLESGNVSKNLKQLYSDLNKLTTSQSKRTELRSNLQSRVDEKGYLSSKDTWARKTVAQGNIHYANGRQGVDPATLRTNVEKAKDQGTWQGVFKSQQDYERAQKTLQEIITEEFKIKEDVKQLDKELSDLAIKINEINSKIAAEQSSSKAAPEVAQAQDLQKDFLVQTNNQLNANAEENQKENSATNAAAIENTTKALNKQSNSLGSVLKQFSLYAIAYRTIKKAMREAVKTIKEVDRALTEQAMVTGLTRKQTYGLLKDYQDMASRLGSTTKEVSSTMTQFLRQGRSINESLKLTEAAVSAAKVAGISAADSINYLTTAINGFRLSADDAMKVSDKFAAVAASAATSYEEIAIALSKVAAQANLAGMSIDYTTALLTKGIETTREAPETIGTALKTVIARMRELSDYGETLGGDTDINNVESQLAYIGIALRDNNGELRSTEEVLNELGGKWDELNANQQAAIAKALAGTRQQSRLIAMMSDYERVIELQEIAERSQGATMAQMATYMEGMDAALNKVNVAWENIVTAVTDSNAIIDIINSVANLMEWIADILSNDVTLIMTLVAVGSVLLINLTKRYEIQKAHNRLILAENKEKLKQRLLILQARQAALLEAKAKLPGVKLTQKELKLQAQLALLDKDKSNDFAALQAQQAAMLDTTQDELTINKELALVDAQITGAKYEMLNTDIQIAQNAAGIGEIWGNLASVMTPIISILTIINTLQQAYAAAQLKSAAAAKVQTAAEGKKAAVQGSGMAAGIISAFSSAGIPGVIAGIAIAGALLAVLLGMGLAIAASAGAFKQDSGAEKAAKDINKLSKEIYELNKKSQELNNVISKFEDLDNKILKTNKDLEEMATLLDSAADSLSDEEKEYFNTLDTTGKYHYLQEVKERTDRDLAAKRNAQRNKIINLRSKGGQNWTDFITNPSNSAEITQAQSAIYSLNNAYLYEQIDEFKKLSKDNAKYAKDIEKMTQNMLSSLSVEKAAALLANPSQIDQYIKALGSKGDAASILQSDDYTIRQRVEAFEELRGAVAELGDPEILEAFKTINKEWQTFSTMSKDTLDYIDAIGADIDGINELASAIQKIGYTADESAKALDDMFQLLQTGANLHDTIADMFGMDNYDSILNAYDKAFGTTILNMGQNIDKFKNTVDGFYEKAAEWATMSDTDKTSFISEHADLFKGEQGGVLLQAFESGNYARIEEALRTNDALSKQREQLINYIDKQLKIEYARQELDYAYIRELEQNKKELEDLSKVYLASLKMRYDQQQAQLEMYKDLLQKETDALTESLEKRKEAYQKYFDAINKEYEEEEYEEKAQTLIANITKLGSSLNGDAVAKRADLTKQLEELEAERLKTLREQAQQAMISSIEDQVTQINENLEKLLTNEQALLTAMMNDTQNPSNMIASMMAAQAASGNNTELGMQNYLQQIQSTFASIMPNVDWSNIDVERQGDSLILNIMGQSIQLSDSDQQTIYEAIQSALKQLGYN